MKKSTFQPDTAGAKPTLLSRPRLVPLAAGDAGEESILSASKMGPLGKFGKKRRSAFSTRKSLQIFAVLGISAAAAFLGYLYFFERSTGSTLASAADHTAVKTSVAPAEPIGAPPGAASPVVSEPAAPPQVALAASVAIAPEAAQIVNESHPLTAAPSASGDAKLTAALEEGVKPPAAALQKALENKTADKTSNKIQTGSKAEKTTVATGKKASPATKTRTAGAKAVPDPDKDVNLLAAFITHNNGLSAPSGPASWQPAIVKAGAAPAPEKVARVSGTPSTPSRDVVERQPSETTAALLKRCSALGFIEGELCRVRICSDQWDTDAACKASLSSAAQ